MSASRGWLAHQPKAMRQIAAILVCIRPMVSVGKPSIGAFFTKLHASRMETDVCDIYIQNRSLCVLCGVSTVNALPVRVLMFSIAESIVVSKKLDELFPI